MLNKSLICRCRRNVAQERTRPHAGGQAGQVHTRGPVLQGTGGEQHPEEPRPEAGGTD